MEKILTEVCHEVNNYFRRDSIRKTFSVLNGKLIGLPDGFLQEGQYFLVSGSVFNDGVHKNSPELMLNGETFFGDVWSLGIPQEFLDLVTEIGEWNEKNGGVDGVALSPFSSESFGGYSYSKSGAGSSADGSADGANWKTVFASRLSKWRRVRGIV